MFSTLVRGFAQNQRQLTHRLRDDYKTILFQPKQSNPITIQCMNNSDNKISAFDFANKPKRVAELDINDFEFEEKILHSEFPMVVNFHAEWCEPCHKVTPALKKAVFDSEYVVMATLVPEDNVEVTMQFRIEALPTILAFNQGYLVKKLVGLVDTEEVSELVQKMDLSYKKRLIMSNVKAAKVEDTSNTKIQVAAVVKS